VAGGAERLGGDAALARDLDPPVERAVGVFGHRSNMPPRRVHPELATRRVDDRAGGAVVVAVGVGADDEPDVAQLQLRRAERQLELVEAVLAADPGVEEDDAVAAGDRPGVHMGNPGPRAREPEPGSLRQAREQQPLSQLSLHRSAR